MKIFSRTETDVRAFTFVELLIIVTTVAVFVGLLLPALVVTGQKSSRIQCATNLKNIGLGFRISGTSHGDRFPIRVTIDEKGTGDPADSTQAFQYFQAFSNEWNNPKILVCPADSRQPASDLAHLRNENISYFLGLNAHQTYPESFLAGDRNLVVNGAIANNRIVELTTDKVVKWTAAIHNRRGNIVLGDGSVQQVDNRRLAEELRGAGNVTNRIVVP